MRILIVADMEGAAGIHRRAQCFSMKPEHAEGRAHLTADVNAVIAGAFDAGASSVHVRDTHEAGANLLKKELDPRAAYTGGHFIEPVPIIGALNDADSVMLVASHAMSGAEDAFFPHTFFGAFKKVLLNGIPRGESFIYAASLAEFGVPISFNSGDAPAVNESLQTMPWLKTVSIPKDEAFYSSPDASEKITDLRSSLRAAAADAVRNHSEMQLLKTPPSPKWEVVVKDEQFAAKINTLGLDRDENSLRWETDTYTAGFKTLFKLVQSSFMAMLS